MSAGRGVAHSERNASNDEAFHLLQIWILPSEHGAEPSYAEARDLLPASEHGLVGLRKLVAAMGGGGALDIGQDATVYAGRVLVEPLTKANASSCPSILNAISIPHTGGREIRSYPPY